MPIQSAFHHSKPTMPEEDCSWLRFSLTIRGSWQSLFVTCIHLLLLCSASLNTSFVRLAHHNNICLCDTSKHLRANKNAALLTRFPCIPFVIVHLAPAVRVNDHVASTWFLDSSTWSVTRCRCPTVGREKHSLGLLFIHITDSQNEACIKSHLMTDCTTLWFHKFYSFGDKF